MSTDAAYHGYRIVMVITSAGHEYRLGEKVNEISQVEDADIVGISLVEDENGRSIPQKFSLLLKNGDHVMLYDVVFVHRTPL